MPDNLATGWKANLNPRAASYEVDPRSPEVDLVASEVRPEAVFYIGAQSSVVVSVRDRVLDVSVNVAGMVGLLQACVKHGVRKVVFASSGCTLHGEPEVSMLGGTPKAAPFAVRDEQGGR